MRDRAIEIALAEPNDLMRRNVLREYLQSRVLGIMLEAGAFIPLAFMGGTALRFRYRIERFSEDLDFALERDAAGFDFTSLVTKIVRGLEREGYAVDASAKAERTVQIAFIGFAELLAEVGIAPQPATKLKIKLEVDTNPPAGAGIETAFARGGFSQLRLQFHDLPSLFAGKTAAVLARSYTKGRDFFDLSWYLGQAPVPEMNVALLANAIEQTAGAELAAAAANDWRGALRNRLARVDWDDAWRDVEPFLEHPERERARFSAAAFGELLG